MSNTPLMDEAVQHFKKRKPLVLSRMFLKDSREQHRESIETLTRLLEQSRKKAYQRMIELSEVDRKLSEMKFEL